MWDLMCCIACTSVCVCLLPSPLKAYTFKNLSLTKTILGARDSIFGIATISRTGRSRIPTTVTIGASDKAEEVSIVCVIERRNREATQQAINSIM